MQTQAQTEKFAVWFMHLTLKAAEINKTYGGYVTYKVGSVQDVPVVDVTIPPYGKNEHAIEERVSPLVDVWKLDVLLEDIVRYEQYLAAQKRMMMVVRETISTMNDEALQAFCDHMQGTAKEPPNRRERVLYECVLAEQVRRKSKT